MEKKTNIKTTELYNSIKESWNTTHTFLYRINGDKENTFPIEIYDHIAIADIKAVVDYVAALVYATDYNIVLERALIAKLFLESFTDMPIPVTNKNGEDFVDYNMCYEIVFGQNGIMKYDYISRQNIELIIDFININGRTLIASEKVAQKILDLYEIFQHEIVDLKNNPVRQNELIDFLQELTDSNGVDGEK